MNSPEVLAGILGPFLLFPTSGDRKGPNYTVRERSGEDSLSMRGTGAEVEPDGQGEMALPPRSLVGLSC